MERKILQLIKSQNLQSVKKNRPENEIACLMIEIELEEAAAISGCSSDAFRRNLHRRKADFVSAMKAVDC